MFWEFFFKTLPHAHNVQNLHSYIPTMSSSSNFSYKIQKFIVSHNHMPKMAASQRKELQKQNDIGIKGNNL